MRFISPLISDARGSIGGTTFGRNPWGTYTRARTPPAQPRTASQVANRALFTTAAQAWKALDPALMVAWSAYAETTYKTDSLGKRYTPSGFQTFVSCMRNLQSIGSSATPAVPNAPVVFPAGFYLGVGFSLSGTTITSATAVLSVDWAPWVGAIVMGVSAPHSPGQLFVGRGLLRNITPGPTVVGTEIDITPGYTALYPTATAGQLMVSRIRYVDPSTGVASAWQTGEFGVIE